MSEAVQASAVPSMRNFNRYPRYKPSGIGWLGQVPEHWEVKKLAYVARLKSGDNITSEQFDDAGEYPVFGGNGIRGRSSEFTHQGEFVLIGRQGALCGNVNYASGRFWASEHAVVVSPSGEFATLWMGELLRIMNLNQYSVSAAQPGLSVDVIGALKIPVPPATEQHAIADYLECETAKIDALIAKKWELIEKLKEKRSALISRTATLGLHNGERADDKLKPSGVDWLGDLPEHWDVRRFSREVQIAEGQVDPETEPCASMLLVAPNHVESGTGRLLQHETAAEQGAESGKYFCSRGDVIYSKIRPALAKVVIAPRDCLCSADMYPLRVGERLTNTYLLWLLLSQQFTAWSILEADRVAMPKINRETLNALQMPCPPLDEQRAIASFLDLETASIDRVMGKVESALNVLQEYRVAIVSAAVKGQIDVRGEAP